MLIAVLGSFVQSSCGFGYAIIVMALLPLVLPFHQAAVIEIITVFIMTAMISIRMRKYINIQMMIWPAAASMLTSIIGVYAVEVQRWAQF